MSRGLAAWSAFLLLTAMTSGQTPSVFSLVPGTTANQSLGLAVAGGQDLDGDQVADVVVVAAREANGSAGLTVSAFSGASGALLWEAPTGLGGSFLGDLVLIGDLDQDTVPDVLFGQPVAAFNGMNAAGVVRLLSGADGSLIQEIGGLQAGASFGGSLVCLGDLDLDGVDDFAASQPGAPLVPPLGVGSIRVVSGATRQTLVQFTAATPQLIGFGENLTRVDDRDGDGFDDIACGAPSFVNANGLIVGSVEIHSSTTGGFIARIEGSEPGAGFGGSLAGLGDVDRDGVGDLAVGADAATSLQGFPMAGRVTVFSGATSAPVFSVEGQGADRRLGTRLVSLGDVDGEGSADLAVAAFDGAPGLSLRGRIHLLFGPSGARRLTLESEALPGIEGAFAAPGDADGDGRADLLVGRPSVDGDPMMPLAGAGRVEALAGLAEATRTYGNVLGGTPSGPLDVLGVSGAPFLLPSSGGHGRRVSIAPASPSLEVWLAVPPGTLAPARYVIFAAVADLTQATPFTLPLGLGELCFEPLLLAPLAAPPFLTLADTFGVDPLALPSSPALLGLPGGSVLSLSGLPPALTVTLQGLIEDTSQSSGLAITNALEVTLP